ncbi:ABC transporter substrate-binding protein [uncultured Gimesia sp.]|uniref:ABC transporter substrate-binding protein n=1 Tax=uncultured Gimesia sp. TaxID=1678688 RepID=UPI00260B65F9|nr:cobalamin-binding protein [uncultured Gimesia sp.]
MKKINPGLLLILMMLGGSAGCGSGTTELKPASSEMTPALSDQQRISEFPVVLKDYRGREIEIPQKPVHIISLLPSHTEILYAIGAGPQMVGCTTSCNYPAETKDLNKVAISDPGVVSLETLVALKPDLVFLGGDYHRLLADRLTKLKIPVLSFESQSVAEIELAIRGISRSTGHVESGDELIREMNQEIKAIQDQLKPYQKQGRPLVFYQVWDQPLMTAGPTSFIGALIKLAGGKNVFDDVKIAYPQVSEETLILRNPEVILLPQLKEGSTDPAATLLKLSQRPGWKQMNAVKNKRVYLIEDDLISRPGPRVVQGLQKIAQALYPEAFQEQ